MSFSANITDSYSVAATIASNGSKFICLFIRLSNIAVSAINAPSKLV
ncbi:hypothetical protein GXM_09869 [Nostoc sphaeroides CCNUC1]|uniref:Uncharacterized protein n=1 Tax=Nostoc sphaeroides CCNUC1 TaxID=2653204 RepID=A0A5P8WHT5_9NOSO|nr:hypothetical protein GXM_09869 [Nostoc sphaeroides CCNUC1]